MRPRRRPAARRPCRSAALARARSAQGCRARRRAPGFWWSGRLWNGQWPGSASPFCALSVAVCLDDGGVNHGVFQVGLVRDGVEQPLPDARLHPIAEAGEHAVPVPERRRQIAPGAARADHPQDGLDKPPIVLTAAPRITGLAQTTRPHLRPLGVRQYKAFHAELEAQPSTDENRESQQALGRGGFRRGYSVGLVGPLAWTRPQSAVGRDATLA